jgi:hypothetical protein
MGEMAEMALDGTLDFYTGEYLDGDSPGYPRTFEGGRIKGIYDPLTPAEKKIKGIKIELKKLIRAKQKTCSTSKERDAALNSAREEINKKYGKGWRLRGLTDDPNNQWSAEDLKKYSKPKGKKK